MAATQNTPTSCKVILAGTVAKSLSVEISEALQQVAPLLIGLGKHVKKSKVCSCIADIVQEFTKFLFLSNLKSAFSTSSGLRFELREVDREELEQHVLAANIDDLVDGIIIYYPIFGNRQDQYLQQITDVSKDVEGLSHRYIFNMYQNIRFLDKEKLQKSILPCTPLAVVKILEYLRIYNTILPYGNRLFGRSIIVINRSEVVGRPLAALLANDGATVYSVDVNNVQLFTRGEGIKNRRHEVIEKPEWGLKDCLPLSDVVISGVPGDSFKVPTGLLRDGAVCVNFSSEKNFGPEVKEKASIYVPAIGKVTIIVLLRNLLRIVQNRKGLESQPAKAVEKPGTIEEAAPQRKGSIEYNF